MGKVVNMQEQVILEGRYRIIRCLVQRPRLKVYLGRRLPVDRGVSSFLNDLPEGIEPPTQNEQEYEPLVAIRELDLTGLSVQMRMLLEAAAFEEFVAPSVFGSSRLPTTGDRVWIEGNHHYLVLQISDVKQPQFDAAMPLDTLLLESAMWPEWIDMHTALSWTTRLGRMIARLHRQGIVLGSMLPSMILVDGRGSAGWSPVLLPVWPPAPSYWKTTSVNVRSTYAQIFPIADRPIQNPFAAPELLDCSADERSDVYAVGAVLYLLLAHLAPVSPVRRLHILGALGRREYRGNGNTLLLEQAEGLELIPPHFLNESISPLLEQVVLRALELEPARRYQSAFEFVEALERVLEL